MSSTTSHDPLAELHAQAQSSLDEGDAQAARQVWEAILQIDPEHAGAQAGLHRLDGGTGAAPEFASGDDALRRAAIARAREKISLDRIEEAHGLLQELEEEHPGDPEVAMLLAQTECRMPPPQAFAPPSPAGSDIGLDLELDLAASATAKPKAAVAPPPVPKPPPARPAPEIDKSTLRDLLDAAGSIDDAPPEARWPEPASPQVVAAGSSSEGSSEARKLVDDARQALAEGRVRDAIAIAGRAMAISENVAGADDVLEEARALETRNAADAEALLADAIEEFERGRPEVAVPLLRQVLDAVPGHTEALEYLRRADVALAAPTTAHKTGPHGLDDLDLGEVASIPLGATTAGHAKAPVVDPLDAALDEEFDTAGGKRSALPPSADPLWGAGAPHHAPPKPPGAPPPAPPPIPLIHPTSSAAPMLPPPPAATAAGAPTAAAPAPPRRAGRSSNAKSGGGRLKAVIVLIVLAAVGAGTKFALRSIRDFFSGSSDAASEAALQTPVTAAAGPRAKKKQQQGEASAAAQANAAGASADQANAAPSYSRADVPRLLDEAERALASRDEAGAVELLMLAQKADPSDFTVLDRLEVARTQLRARQEADERIAQARDSFANGSYEEALRIFYRLPPEHRPPDLDSWIAAGWYNLGLLAMQAGHVAEARRFLADCLEHAPDDADAKRLREIADRYRSRDPDDAFRAYVGALAAKPLPE